MDLDKIFYFTTHLYTRLYGEHVGTDEFGNRYYLRKPGKRRRAANNGREERWVIYEGEIEATAVPPEWHGWLHHAVDKPPTEKPVVQPSWGRPHEPNLSGTSEAYMPPGHVLRGGVRPRATGDYEPWEPG